ncbi:conserved hypothetical protein [Candidatus Blochmanniella vafra str. BVAF]|uniref:Lipopolysaccharide export system protein LptC n=1 Tax=Blochmanniella vafra (strain BVAF) TaxID=859654 RepID=E8Q6L6_BLOVB|nr:LPS export ABC transporter periplasmic protein LptC [Candidatus Blochmannia vafer]ADV33457.1 conserved hypothetical protein [Candidatus Blochmannia vafer str. BVAF]
MVFFKVKNKKNLGNDLKCILLKNLLILICICYFYLNTSQSTIQRNISSLNYATNAHHSNEIILYSYNAIGNLKFKLTATYIQCYPNTQIIEFTQPNITIFNKKNIIIWTIKCNKAQLNYKKILNLTGYVSINKIMQNTRDTQSIITNQISINLIKQNMLSNNKTIVHGSCFYSIGTKMSAKLNTKQIKLFDSTYTQYEYK